MRLSFPILLTVLAVLAGGCTSVGPSSSRLSGGIGSVSGGVTGQAARSGGAVGDVPAAIQTHWSRSMHYLAVDLEDLWWGIGKQPGRLAGDIEGGWGAIRAHGARSPAAIGGLLD